MSATREPTATERTYAQSLTAQKSEDGVITIHPNESVVLVLLMQRNDLREGLADANKVIEGLTTSLLNSKKDTSPF